MSAIPKSPQPPGSPEHPENLGNPASSENPENPESPEAPRAPENLETLEPPEGSGTPRGAVRWCVIGWAQDCVALVELDATGSVLARHEFDATELPVQVAAREQPGSRVTTTGASRPRWVWSDTPHWYPRLLDAGVRIERAHDLRLCHAILRNSEAAKGIAEHRLLTADTHWDHPSATLAQAALTNPATNPTAANPTVTNSTWGSQPHAVASLTGEAPFAHETSAALFGIDELGDLAQRGAPKQRLDDVPHDVDAALAEFARQRAVLSQAAAHPASRSAAQAPQQSTVQAPGQAPGQAATQAPAQAAAPATAQASLALLLAAESAGGLIGTELSGAGVPWDAREHDRILAQQLGPRPVPGAKPAAMLLAADETRAALGDATVSLDSPPKLLRALRSAGIEVSSTSQWELQEHEHPAIAPLLRYKKLARLLSANGWAWIDEWVRDGRYRPVYVPGGVVTGRWASSGGGALQLPRLLRPALRADLGWTLVSADVAQLEPRVLAAMAGDRAMARAGHGKDLYSGIVDSGIVSTRQEAKIAVLGAMYGGTSGDSGRLVPRLRRSFPQAMRLVDEAAVTGERGGIVSTWLGRSSPKPGAEWFEMQSKASLPGATSRDEQAARRVARDYGRFTRNFVVQGTAAEWALAWLADLRLRLSAFVRLPDTGEDGAPHASQSGPVFARQPHLVFFLHDEVIVHTPQEHAESVARAVAASASAAGRLLFGIRR